MFRTLNLGDDLRKVCACKNQRTHKLRTEIIYWGGPMRVISAQWGGKSSAFHQVGLTNGAGTGVSGTGEVANGLFSSTQCDTCMHYARITCITCWWKKATQSRAIRSSRWLIHGPLKTCARVTRDWRVACKWQLWAVWTWQLFYRHGENLFPSRAGLTRFTPLLTFVTAGRKKKKKKNPMLSGQ